MLLNVPDPDVAQEIDEKLVAVSPVRVKVPPVQMVASSPALAAGLGEIFSTM